MVRLGITIEGQEGLDWERWHRITDATEELGFDSLWRSDHLFSVMGEPTRETLALWPSLTAVALRTRRIEFGPLVSPTTFRHPVHLAYDAVALDRLSGGRFRLGVGAGWNEAEHHAFGFSLHGRMDRFAEALQVLTLLWSGDAVSFRGAHFHLAAARASLTPLHGARVPLVLGGGGARRTLRLVAEYADEWNMTSTTREVYAAKVAALEGHCRAVGRDPTTIARSLMTAYLIGRDRGELRARAARLRQILPDLRELSDDGVIARARQRGWLVGGVDELVEQIRERGAWGIDRIMLLTFDMDDLAALGLIASAVLPHV